MSTNSFGHLIFLTFRSPLLTALDWAPTRLHSSVSLTLLLLVRLLPSSAASNFEILVSACDSSADQWLGTKSLCCRTRFNQAFFGMITARPTYSASDIMLFCQHLSMSFSDLEAFFILLLFSIVVLPLLFLFRHSLPSGSG